jgi:molybdopterin-guanine dinucleotide biosynthesis protein A
VPNLAFDGYVLCGGASRRMGRDKALVEIDGVAMARRVADALSAAGAGHVVAVGGDAAALARLGVETIPDRWPGEGPLGGLVTALGHESSGPSREAVVLSCDLTQPDPHAVARVVAERGHLGCDAVVPVVDGRHQWLHAAWDRRVAGILTDVFAAGERSVAGAALSLRIATVEVAAHAVHDADRPHDLLEWPPGAGSRARTPENDTVGHVPAPDGLGGSAAAGHRHLGRLAFGSTPTIASVQVPAIDITTLRQKLDDGAPLFDVRQPDEYEEGHAPTARLVPLAEVPERVGEFPADETVYVICKSGGRSAKAVEHLRANGVDAVNVEGGTLAWIEAGNAVEQGG